MGKIVVTLPIDDDVIEDGTIVGDEPALAGIRMLLGMLQQMNAVIDVRKDEEVAS